MRYPPVDLTGLDDDDLDAVAQQLGAGVPEAQVAKFVAARRRAHLIEAADDLTREEVTV